MALLKMILNRQIDKTAEWPEFSNKKAQHARAFHQSMPGYDVTPLVCLDHLSKKLGVKGIFVKDESHRFGLSAFKALGASYAVARLIASELGVDDEPLDYKRIIKALEAFKAETGKTMTLVTATDGNHGRGLAWTATLLGQASVVLMPKGSSTERLENIQKEGAKAYITDWNYDESVREAMRLAVLNQWHLVQDTVLDNYEEIPKWIMTGYMTLGLEVLEQLKNDEADASVTHIFLQAGVGSMAAAMAALFIQSFEKPPKIIVVEPGQADCFYRTAEKNNGQLQIVAGDMNTIMAGLACGEPNPIAWEILKDYADAFVSCSDEVAALGMRILASPLKTDGKVISGESGAVGMGVLYELMKRPAFADLKQALDLSESSKVLIVSTEGATDTAMYRQIVWEGMFPRTRNEETVV